MKATFETRPIVSSLSCTSDTKQSVLPDILVLSQKEWREVDKERKREKSIRSKVIKELEGYSRGTE